MSTPRMKDQLTLKLSEHNWYTLQDVLALESTTGATRQIRDHAKFLLWKFRVQAEQQGVK